MIALLSPAMRMRTAQPAHAPALTTPEFLGKAEQIATAMKALDMDEMSALLNVKADAAVEYFMLWQDFARLQEGEKPVAPLTPAAAAFHGIAYTYLDAASFTEAQWNHAQKHLRHMSGAYGVLRPLDAVQGYRLEMQSRLEVAGAKNLYRFWGDDLAQSIVRDCDGTIVLLLSSEYLKAIKRYLPTGVRVIETDFKIMCKSGYRTQSTWAKISRGRMARMIATQGIVEPEPLKAYDFAGFAYREDLSSENCWVFTADEPTLPEG